MTLTLTFQGDLDLPRSPKVKSKGAVGLPIYDFLLVSNNMSISHRLAVIAAQKFFSYLLSLGGDFGSPTPTLTPEIFFFWSKSNITSSLAQMEAFQQNEVDWLNTV